MSLLSLNLVQAQSCRIAIEIPDMPEQILRLGYHSGPDIFVVDSLVTDENGQGIFQANKALSHGVYFVVMPSGANFDFLVGNNQHFKLYTKQYHVLDSLKVTGDMENAAFVRFQQTIAGINKQERMLDIQKRFYQNNEDSIQSITKQQNQLSLDRKNLFDSYSDQFEGTVLGALIRAMNPLPIPAEIEAKRTEKPAEYFDYLSQHYFDHIDFSEPAIFNAPVHVFHNQLETFCTYFLNARADSILRLYREVDALINKASASQAAHKYVVSYLIQRYEHPDVVGMDAVFVHLSRNYLEKGKLPWANTQVVQEISKRADLMEQSLIGKEAANLKFPDVFGEMHALHEGEGRYTVLWFYETSCDICKHLTPEFKSIYDDMQVLNIDLIAINIDQDKEAWERFLAENNFKFTNVWNPDKNPDLLYAYGLYKTPRLFVLNADKQIVAKDLRVDVLLDYIEYLDEKSPHLRNRFLFQSPMMQH